MKWQPIETAPKDGRSLWLVEDGMSIGLAIPHQCVGYWVADRRYTAGGSWVQVDRSWILSPTHWMPLPDPPKRKKVSR